MLSIFGASGFIGSNFCKLYPNISFPEKRESIISQNNNILYLRGTNSNYNVFIDPTLDIRTNLLLFAETLKNLTLNNNFTIASSWFCYFPKGFYSITKLCQEQLLESYCNTFDINYKILRLSNIFGNDLKANATKNALEYMIGKIKNNEDVHLYDGDNYRNCLDIETCCKAIKFIMDKGENKQIYNIGADQSYKIGDLLQYCIDRIKSKSKIKRVEIPKFHKQVQIENFFMDTNKIVKLGFDNKINIYEKLDKILICYDKTKIC